MGTQGYRVGIIGCGRVAWLLDADPLIPNKPVTHVGAYERVRKTKVVAGADVRPDRIDAFSHVVGKEHVYLDYRDMLAREQLDIISVCAYAPDRYRMVMDAVGCHDQVPDILRVQRYFELQGVLDRPHRGQCVNRRSTPQMRWVKSHTSRGSRPFTMFSIPRSLF
jgi:hypothetical protein